MTQAQIDADRAFARTLLGMLAVIFIMSFVACFFGVGLTFAVGFNALLLTIIGLSWLAVSAR